MKILKKISLGRRSTIPDDVEVALLNDRVKKKLLQKKINNANAISENKKTPSLLERLWPSIEHFTQAKRQEAIKIITKLEAFPTLEINENLELVYNGDPVRGTNIVQLIRSEVDTRDGDGRTLLPGQDLFYHALLTSPAPSIQNSTRTKKGRKLKHASPPVKNRKKLTSSLLQVTPRKALDYSPVHLRTRATTSRYGARTPAIKEGRWKK